MKNRSGFHVMINLVGLVKPLTGYMVLAIIMGLVGHLAASFITIFGGYAVANLLDFDVPFSLRTIFISVCVFALARGILRYAEQACNHFIAFKLLALIRDKVFMALRKLCPAKLEGRDKGNLISVITSDIELLEVFYAHTISPIVIAFLYSLIMCLFIGSFHPILGVIALLAYITVGIFIPLMSSFGPTVALANLGSTLQNTFAAGNRVLDILDETPVVDEISGKNDIAFTGASAEKITFSYDEEKILDHVSVNIPKGAIVGITGRSGSGKSTLLKLFMRFWETQEGSVKLSETDVNNINTSNLRDMESFVTQETHMFHDSIKNNLRIAKLDATDKEIVTACKKASVHDFILSLPQGYDTPVGELGDTLSGGERQRLGLARAFLHDSDLLLLDEPTSNLDSLNEAVILK